MQKYEKYDMKGLVKELIIPAVALCGIMGYGIYHINTNPRLEWGGPTISEYTGRVVNEKTRKNLVGKVHIYRIRIEGGTDVFVAIDSRFGFDPFDVGDCATVKFDKKDRSILEIIGEGYENGIYQPGKPIDYYKILESKLAFTCK